MSRGKWIGVGVVGLVVGAGAAFIPITDDYSQFGFGFGEVVTLDCGNAFSDDVTIDARSGEVIGEFERIFELDDGRVVDAREACDDSRSTNRIVAIVAGLAGAVLVVLGIALPGRTPAAPPPSFPNASPSPSGGSRPAGPPARTPPPPDPPPPTQRPPGQPPPPDPPPPAPTVARPSGAPTASAPPRGASTSNEPAPSPSPGGADGGAAGNDWWNQPGDDPTPHAVDRFGADASTDPNARNSPSAASSPPPNAAAAPIPDPATALPAGPVHDLPTPPDAASGEFRRPVDSSDGLAIPVGVSQPGEEATVDQEKVDETAAGNGNGIHEGAVAAEEIEQFELQDGRLLLVGDVSVVGRSPAAPASYPDAVLISVDDPTVSKSHAAFGRVAGELWAEDLHSRNGLVVIRADGTRVMSPAGETIPLALGDVVQLGDHTHLRVTLHRRPGHVAESES